MNNAGRIGVFAGLIGTAAALLMRQRQPGGQSGIVWKPFDWFGTFGGWGGSTDAPAGDVGIGPIVADTPEGEAALDEPANPPLGVPLDGGPVTYRNPNMPRGIRNMNPGNLRRTGTPWRGKSIKQTDDAFVQFDSPVYGIRALARVLQTYRGDYGLNTVAEIINRWAPPVENNTGAYVSAVAGAMGVPPGEPLDNSEPTALALVEAIVNHENGFQPYSTETLLAGIRLA